MEENSYRNLVTLQTRLRNAVHRVHPRLCQCGLEYLRVYSPRVVMDTMVGSHLVTDRGIRR